MAVAVASGHGVVRVPSRPRVGILSSGDELVGVDAFQRVIDGVGIPDTNRQMLLAAIRELDATPVDLGIVQDSPEALRDAMESLPDLDVLVTTGGASMGEKDLFKRILEDASFELAFWRAKIRPGSPVSFGHMKGDESDLPVFGLPGNPASAFVTFHVFVTPYLRSLAGCPPPHLPTLTAYCSQRVSTPAHLTHFLRVALAWDENEPGRVTCTPTGPQGSGLVAPLLRVDGLAVVPEGVGDVQLQEPLKTILLPGGRISGA